MPEIRTFVRDNHPAVSTIAKAIEDGHWIADPDGLTQWYKARNVVQELYNKGLLIVKADEVFQEVVPTVDEIRAKWDAEEADYNDHEPLT